MAANRQYDHEFKVQAIKLAQEIGQAKAAKELGISKSTMYTWTRAHRLGYLDLECGTQTPQSALSLHEELVQLRAQLKAQDKEIRRLKNKIGEINMYFDNAATTPLLPEVIDKMSETMKTTFGNPSSLHAHGRIASKLLRESREQIAQSLHTLPNRIFFTSGGSESNNTVIKGYCLKHQADGKHIITTALEHHAVLEPIEYLVERFGFEVTIVQPRDGRIQASDIKAALRPDTILVSTMFANNETGDLLPIKEIGELLKDHPAAFHVDAVQAIGKVPVYPEELGINFLSASAHKFHGPKGVGFLYAAVPDFDNLIHGGDQEIKMRASTENLISIVGMATALQQATLHQEENFNQVQKLGQELVNGLAAYDYYVNANDDHLPFVWNLGFPGVQNDVLLMRLDLAGISVSTGSACTAGTVQPSHVLEALYGKDSSRLKESLRISFSELNTVEEVQDFLSKLKEILS